MQHIKIISDLYPSNCILVCDKLSVNNIQRDCFSRKRVPVVRVDMKVEVILVFTTSIYGVFGLEACSTAIM